jgi:acyl dehydratase
MENALSTQAYSTQVERLADLKQWVGKELGLTDWIEITQEDIDTFARITDDEQWIHVDPVRAKAESPYGTTIAHGFMILSLVSKAAYETYSIGNLTMGINYGLDKVRFPNATPVGALLRARVSLMEFAAIGEDAARYKLKVYFEIKDQEKPACVAEFLAQAYSSNDR